MSFYTLAALWCHASMPQIEREQRAAGCSLDGHAMPDPPTGANMKSVQSLPGLPAWQPEPKISPVVGST